jgi:hypothetical protein
VTEQPAGEQQEEQQEEPIGWQVLDPDGNVVAAGGQTVTEASADASEAGDADGGD